MPNHLARPNPFLALCIILSAAIYIYFGYWLDRTDFGVLFSLYALLFAAYIFIIRQSENVGIRLILFVAIGLRLLFLFSTPTLSDDVFRFIWDGNMWKAGINPYLYTPEQLISSGIHVNGNTVELYNQLN